MEGPNRGNTTIGCQDDQKLSTMYQDGDNRNTYEADLEGLGIWQTWCSMDSLPFIEEFDPKGCNRCLDYGHVAERCCSLLCRGEQDVDAKHIAEEPKCPYYISEIIINKSCS